MKAGETRRPNITARRVKSVVAYKKSDNHVGDLPLSRRKEICAPTVQDFYAFLFSAAEHRPVKVFVRRYTVENHQ